MAANFQQHMGGPGQMIPQQQQQQRPQQQQQQQGNQNNNASSQIQQHIYTMLQQQTGPLSGWQAQVLSTERMGLIFSIIGNLRLASQNQPNSPPLQRMIEIGIKFEKDIFDKAAHKEQYKHEISQKLRQLQERRNAQQAHLQAQITQQAQQQAQAQQASQAQQMMMNQQGMQGQGPRPMPQQQQSFQHLQHQMQASPLPGQQPQQPQMGMPNQGQPQNMQQLSQQQQFQMALQQQQQQQQGGVPRPGPQVTLTQQDAPRVMELAAMMFANTSEQEKMSIRQRFLSTLNQDALQRLQATNVDPLQGYFRNAAATQVRQDKMARMAQQGSIPQQGHNIPVSAPPMQPQRSMQPSPMNAQAQAPPSMSATPEYSQFMAGIENAPPTIKHNAVAQQQQGVLAQQAGQMVVPVSGAGDATPQPGAMNNREMLMSEQMGANPNQRAQMQQMFNAQQLQQQQRMQQAQQGVQQPQARINAQAQAQQNMALQGQPGGMNGPISQQQSPALQNINQPMRAQGQQMPNSETPQPGPNGPFGQPLDPRFMQANQRPSMGANGMNGFPNIPPERLAQIPPDKLEEMMAKWGQNRPQGMNPANVPGGRPQMPMQGNPQARPGQQNPQQPGQFNAQQAVASFMMANPGQRPPAALTAGMTPQQQMMLQQQMAAMRPNPNMQRPPNFMQMDQRNSQMEVLDIPQVLLVHQHMPQGFPPEVKKWGQMKHWVSQNPAMGPPHLDAVNKLQRSHLQMIMKQRQQPQPGGMQPGAPIPQGGAPPNPVGMGAAPVATMVPNPMQMGPGNNMPGPPQIRQPISAHDILQARTQAGPKLAQATDDQIRNFLMARQAHAQGQMNPQQQHLLRQQQMQIQANRMAQLNNGQPASQPNQQQPNSNATAPNSVKPQNQVQQSKPPQPEPAANSANIANRPRTQQQQQNARNSIQNSSPAQPSNKLKRASSDDVIEVPNPNAQQSRPAPQPTQDKPHASQQPSQFKALAPHQIAALKPEERKRYEAMLQQRAQSQNNPLRDLTAEQQERFRKLVSEEQQSSRNPLPDLPMDAETKKRMQDSLQAVLPHAKNVSKVIPRWFALTLDDERTRKYFRTHFRFCKQFVDGNSMTKPRETFSITPQEVDTFKGILESIVIDMKTKHPGMLKGDAARPQAAPAPQPVPQATQPVPPPSTPLSSANLQQQQAQLKLHQRSNSKSSHTPAAPTSSQPPFQFGAASPHGTPIYNSRTGLTQENLHLPARKKQKPNTGTPAGQVTPGSNSSPKVAKSVSPEIKRQQPPDVKPPAKPSLSCSDPDCATNNLTFDTEEALKKHRQDEHVRPLENPLNFALDQLSNSIGLDPQGKSKKPVVPQAQTSPKGAKMASSASKQVHTPNIRNGSTPSGATPMMRQASMNRQASTTGKPSVPSKDVVKPQPGQKETSKQPEPQATMDLWADSTIDPTELFSTFSTFEAGAGGAISDMNVYRSITPNDTPESSKDGVSEPNSDISEGVNLDLNLDLTFDENWQPFGDTAMLDMNGYSNNDDALNMFDHMETSAVEQTTDYQIWDDLVDNSMFDKPFQMDTSGFDMGNIDFD